MSISGVSGIAGVGPVAVPGIARPGAPEPGFGELLAKGLESVSAGEAKADSMVAAMAAGGDVQPHEVMLATSKASLSVELAVAVRDKALDAYREIMNLQL